MPTDDQTAGGWSDPTTQSIMASYIIPVIEQANAGHDNDIWWSALGHNSRDSQYRTPGGAVPTGTAVTLPAARRTDHGRGPGRLRSVLLHCIVAWRASHLWAAYLVRHQGFTVAEAYARGEAIGIGEMPLAGLLDRKLEVIAAG